MRGNELTSSAAGLAWLELAPRQTRTPAFWWSRGANKNKGARTGEKEMEEWGTGRGGVRRGKIYIKKRGLALRLVGCARAPCARTNARRVGIYTHAHTSSLCVYILGPDARRRPSSSTTTHRIVMRDRDTRRVFPPPRGKPSRPRARFGASSRENAAS